MIHMNITTMPPLPTIRLRVWHHSDFAPTPEDNLHLSNFLGSFETGPWHVQPAEVLTETCWDHTFVPVEVSSGHLGPFTYTHIPLSGCLHIQLVSHGLTSSRSASSTGRPPITTSPKPPRSCAVFSETPSKHTLASSSSVFQTPRPSSSTCTRSEMRSPTR